MDRTDMSLMLLLSANSRLSYAELAEKLNLSVNAVHKRIQLLREAGVICKFTAKVSLSAAKAIVVFISGTSQLSSFQDLPNKLKAQGSIYWLAVGGGKLLHIGAYIRHLNELDALSSYIKKEAMISEPTIGIMSPPPVPIQSSLKPIDDALCDLDYRIINSLKDDSRKAISEVAEELGISAKTARRRLTRMIQKGLIELSIEWYPDKSNDILTIMYTQLKSDADICEAATILKKFAPNALFYWTYVNLPNAVTFVVWTNSMNELQNLREKLEKEKSVASIVPNILLIGYIFNTWRDQLA